MAVNTVDINKVADYFIARAHEVGEPISNLKLQKLVYYAQAWHLALKNRPLIEADFEAWVHGPVNPSLYRRFRANAWKPIADEVPRPALPDDVRKHLEEVWQVYGGLSALDLERMTHAEEPWKIARGDLPPDALCDNEISPESMKAFYARRLERSKKK